RGEALQDTTERATIEVLHHDEVVAVALFDVRRLHDIRMAQPGGDTGFVEEHRPKLHVFDQLGLELFERDQLGEPGRAVRGRQVDDAHSSSGELGDQTVTTDLISTFQLTMRQKHDSPSRSHLLSRSMPMSMQTNN